MRTVRVLLGSVLGAAAVQAATELVSGAGTVFQAPASVTFGAVYSERAVKATVVSPTPVAVTVQSGRKPANVFVGDERLAPTAWQFEAAKGTVTTALPAGTTTLQLRFDDLTDLKPYQATLPVVVVGADGQAGAPVGTIALTVSGEKAFGSWAWAGPEGLYRLRAVKQGGVAVGVQLSTGAPAGTETVLLQAGTPVTVQGEAPGQKVPIDRVECRQEGVLTPTQRVAKGTLAWAGSVVLEGEAFRTEGGGTVSRSTEHGNTHGGGCIYAWGTPGHWLAWEADVPATGDYILTLVFASQEKVVLRSLSLDGQPAAAGAVMRLEGTGGWGRTNADEWQAAQPVDAQGRPVRFHLAAGRHEVRLENLLGQHLNVDCLLLTPVQ